MVWTNQVPLVQNGEPVDAPTTNKSAIALAERTAALRSMIESITAGRKIVFPDAPIDAGVEEGHVVSLNLTSLLHELSLSSWEDLTIAEGIAVPTENAIYTGVVIKKCSETSADILLSGLEVLESAALDRLFGTTTPANGLYFLSSQDAGQVSMARSGPNIRVLQYAGDGLIRVFPFNYDPVTHQHYCFKILQADWVAAGGLPNPPVGATFGVDLTTANSIAEGTSEAIVNQSGPAVFVNLDTGTHLLGDEYFVDENGIWTNQISPTFDIELCVTQADVKDMALLHTIENLTEQALELISNNGRVKIGWREYNVEADQAGHIVVKGIDFDNHALLTGPVVEQIVAGPGISISATAPEGKGQVTITNALYHNLRLASQVLNLDNAVTSIEGVHVITNFPSDRLSKVNYMVQLPEINEANFTARIWVQVISPGATQNAPDCEYSLIPTPDAAGVTPTALTPLALPAFPGVINAGDVYYIESGDIPLVGYSNGLISYSLEYDQPTPDLKIISTGIILIDGSI
jgi:hypothetical protein